MDAVGPYVPACQMMGSMLAQIHGEVPQYLKLTAAGSLADADPSILVAGTVKGLLSYQGRATVTPVNADAVAQRHGIKVEPPQRFFRRRRLFRYNRRSLPSARTESKTFCYPLSFVSFCFLVQMCIRDRCSPRDRASRTCRSQCSVPPPQRRSSPGSP